MYSSIHGKNGLPLNPVSEIKIYPAATEAHLIQVRELFMEYASSLEISLCFQNFEQELANLPGSYAPPRGALLLAEDSEQVAGCIGLRPLDDYACEMKRLYVRSFARGKGLGRALALAVILVARDAGYQRMRLDTLSSMQPAISLYGSLGFQRIPAYYSNPSDSAVFMELNLGKMAGSTFGRALEK